MSELPEPAPIPSNTVVKVFGGEGHTTADMRRYLAEATAHRAPDDAIIFYGDNLTTVGKARRFLELIDGVYHGT